MNFQRGKHREEPEINFIPLIDVLLVILIFLMVTTTYSKFAELKINLPQANAQQPTDKPVEINVAVDAHGRYMINKMPLVFSGAEQFGQEMRKAVGNNADPVVVINADAHASHQSVINIMEASRVAGYTRITFATQQNSPN